MAFILDSLHKIPILQLYLNLTGIKTDPRWYGLTPGWLTLISFDNLGQWGKSNIRSTEVPREIS